MGGRTGPTTKKTHGHGGSIHGNGGGSTTRMKKNLVKKSPEIAGEVIMEVLALTNPAVAALYAVYKVAKFVYPIAKKGAEEYQKTGDKDKAVEKMKVEAIKQTGKELINASVGIVVQASYSSVVQSSNLKTDKTTDTIVTSVVEKVIEETVVEEVIK